MTHEADEWQRWVLGLRDGDSIVVREFVDQYGSLLHQLADKHLNRGLRRRVGPEDVVQSVCRTFFRRARGGEFQLTDSDNLWRLLCAITLTKVREQTRFHLRRKRGLNLEVEPRQRPDESGASSFGPADRAPTPAEAAEFADQFQQLIAGLDEEERRVIDLKLQECTNEEVAQQLGCSERTVRRIVKRVQSRLLKSFEVS